MPQPVIDDSLWAIKPLPDPLGHENIQAGGVDQGLAVFIVESGLEEDLLTLFDAVRLELYIVGLVLGNWPPIVDIEIGSVQLRAVGQLGKRDRATGRQQQHTSRAVVVIYGPRGKQDLSKS